MAIDREARPPTTAVAGVDAASSSGPAPGTVLVSALLASVGVLMLGLWAGGGIPANAIPGLPDPGAATAWALPIAKLLFDISALATVGALVVGVMLAPSAGGELTATGIRCLRAAAVWAAIWGTTALVTFVLQLSDILGAPVSDVLDSNTLSSFAGSIPQGRGYLLVFVLAVIVAGTAPFVLSLDTGAWLVVVGMAALLPVPLTGHAAGAVDHDIATSSLVAHVIAGSLWVGGLLSLVLYVRRSRTALAVAVPRFSELALWCYIAIGFSGLVNAWVRLGAVDQLVEQQVRTPRPRKGHRPRGARRLRVVASPTVAVVPAAGRW